MVGGFFTKVSGRKDQVFRPHARLSLLWSALRGRGFCEARSRFFAFADRVNVVGLPICTASTRYLPWRGCHDDDSEQEGLADR